MVYTKSFDSNLQPNNESPDLLFCDMQDLVASPNNCTSKIALVKELNLEQQPRTIHPSHLKQWVDTSGVSEEITRLNIYSLEDNKEIAQLLRWKKYDHSPGWWCSGVDPHTGKKLTNGVGQFRPDVIWKNLETGDLAKYLTPKTRYDALCLDTGDPEYWRNVMNNPKIPVIITEGAKKAGAGLSCDYPTISLSGVWMGVINIGTPKKKNYRLVPTLRSFCQPGRIFNLCFDADIARKKEVRDACRFLVSLLTSEGCIVKIVTWDESMGKGMDDYLVNNGKDSFDESIKRAQLIEQWSEQFEDEDRDDIQTLPKHSGMSLILKPRINNLRFNDNIHQWERYQTGYWSITSQESVIQKVTDHIEELYPKIEFDSSYPNGVVQSLISRVLQDNLPEPPRHLLPFQNGVLDLKTQVILPHLPEYNFNSIIDREHDLQAKNWNSISQWMDFIFDNNESQKHLLCCWYAAVLRGMWKLHRFAVFVGEGGTGKSTAMQLGSDLVGKRSSHSLTLEALNTNSFQTGNIYDKRLVCVNDADRYHGNLGVFKNITGGDEINVEWKHEKAFNSVYKGLVMVSANNPVFTANDSGIDRRIILFKLDRKVPKIDTELGQRLSAEMSAFTNYLLSIPEAEIVETLLYKVDDSGVRTQNELEHLLQTNTVAGWLNDRYAYDPDSQVQIGNDKTRVEQLYGDYCDYTSKSGSSPMSSKAFSPEVIRLGRGYLIKKKGMSGAMLLGLRRSECGGLIEKIISTSRNTAFDPSYPSYPSCNDQKAYTETVSGMMGRSLDPSFTRHGDETHQLTMMGHDGSNTHPSLTHHTPQTLIQESLQGSETPNMMDMMGKTEELRASENFINSIPDNLSLTQKMIQAWDNRTALGSMVLGASPDELRKEVEHYTTEQIAHIKEAANTVWKPGLDRDAEYSGERVEIIEASNTSREVVIKYKSGSKTKVKRGNLKPWLGI